MSPKLPSEKLLELRELLAGDARDSLGLLDIDAELSLAIVSIDVGDMREGLTIVQRKYLSSCDLELEVNNGGFIQFLSNKGPQAAADALAFMRERHFEAVADMLERAIQLLPGAVLPATYAELEAILVDERYSLRIGAALEEIDSEFFDMDPCPDLTEDRLRFVFEHSHEFFESKE